MKNLIKDELVKIIAELQHERRDNHIEPEYVRLTLIQEVLWRRAKTCLNELVSDGTLEWSRTVNQIPQFKVKDL